MSHASGSEAEALEDVKPSKKRVTRSTKRASEMPVENIPENLPQKKKRKTNAATSATKNTNQNADKTEKKTKKSDTSSNEITDLTNTNSKVATSVTKAPRGKGTGKHSTNTALPKGRSQPHYWARSPPTKEQLLAVHPHTPTISRGRGRGRGRGSTRKSKGPRVYYWAEKKTRATREAEFAVANLYDSD